MFFKMAAIRHLRLFKLIFWTFLRVWRANMCQHGKCCRTRSNCCWSIPIYPFLPCDAMLSAVYAVVVCLCVCVPLCVFLGVRVCVTLRYCIKTAKCRITQIMPHDSPMTLVFWHQSWWRNFEWDHSLGGDKCRRDGLKFATFDKKCTITQNRNNIDSQFLLKSNRKLYVLYWMAMLLMNLSDP